MKLKTLKDIYPYHEEKNGDILVRKRYIKAEAIKWVKIMRADNTFGWMSFMDFFNITEEDLK